MGKKAENTIFEIEKRFFGKDKTRRYMLTDLDIAFRRLIQHDLIFLFHIMVWHELGGDLCKLTEVEDLYDASKDAFMVSMRNISRRNEESCGKFISMLSKAATKDFSDACGSIRGLKIFPDMSIDDLKAKNLINDAEKLGTQIESYYTKTVHPYQRIRLHPSAKEKVKVITVQKDQPAPKDEGFSDRYTMDIVTIKSLADAELDKAPDLLNNIAKLCIGYRALGVQGYIDGNKLIISKRRSDKLPPLGGVRGYIEDTTKMFGLVSIPQNEIDSRVDFIESKMTDVLKLLGWS
ncbi:hypothetical protein FWC63_02375 [Candidatus Saccharibacteria bacterium]|nr:hypothetical protein [Candidatus Saccharibacteria bacterium]